MKLPHSPNKPVQTTYFQTLCEQVHSDTQLFSKFSNSKITFAKNNLSSKRMKEKILNLLKPLLSPKGFSKEELEGLADIASKNLTDTSTEEDINNVVNGILPYAEMMQRVGNRYATQVEKKYEGYVKPQANPEPAKPKDEPKPSEPKAMTAEDIQKMIREGIAAGLKPYQEREEKLRLQNLLFSNDKVKSIPEVFRNKYSLEKEEDLETVAAQMETDYAALKQSLVTSGEFVAPPSSGNGTGDSDDLISALHTMGSKAK